MMIGHDASVRASHKTGAKNIDFYFRPMAFKRKNGVASAILQWLPLLVETRITEALPRICIAECH